MNTPLDAPGWFGKLPSIGDFASRRLPPVFVEGWDDWLQREMVRSRSVLGAAWLDAFLVAPVRRYWLAPGLLGLQAWAGVWLPSVDSAGRHFPLTVAAPCADVACADDGLPGDPQWFDAVDAVARSALDPHLGVDAFERALAAVESPRPKPATAARSLPPPRAPASWWWCAGATAVADALRMAGLPSGAEFDRLLSPCP